MSLLKLIRVQFGQSSTATQNFTIDASAADGTMKLARGNAGATTQDILTVDATGAAAMPNTPSFLSKHYLSPAQTITSGAQLILPHGMGLTPKIVFAKVVCTTGEFGYSVGDQLCVHIAQMSSSAEDSYGISVVIDPTNLTIRYGAGASVFLALTKNTGTGTNLTNTNWQFYVEAWA